ncbi:hypothetical protein D3C86_1014070 [compost metagenome]
MRLDDLKSQIEHLKWENNHLKSTVGNLTQQNEELKSDLGQRMYVQEMTTQIANEETARKEELKLRVKSLEQTEALLRQALVEQQEERQKMVTGLTNRFAGAFPAFDSDKDALAVVQHLCKCLDDISETDPDWYGDMIDRIGEATNMFAANEYRITNLLRLEVNDSVTGRSQTFIFPNKATLNSYLNAMPTIHKGIVAPARPFYAKPNDKYFVHVDSEYNQKVEFTSSDMQQTLNTINAKGWFLRYIQVVE